MIIDKTHSKKDIIKLFNKHGVKIDENKTKGDILNSIESYINEFKYDNKIKNLTELKLYLQNKSPKQRPSSEEKNIIMFISKKIIKWSKNDYIFDGTYSNKQNVFDDVMRIYKWGDLPSVRRACKLYNASPFCINHINPIISEEIQDELNKNKIIKQNVIYKLKIRRATKEEPIILNFD